MHRKISVLVVEDERIIAEQIRQILIQLEYKSVHVAYSYDGALKLLKEHEFSLALLDINLGKMKRDGIDLAFFIQENYNIPFLFVTANADQITVEKAKKSRPIGYIVKPFTKESIFSTIEIAISNIETFESKQKESLVFHQNGKKVIVFVDEISFFKAEGNYVEAHTNEAKTYLSRQSLKQFKEELSDKFVQVHRSFIINTRRIQSYNSTEIQLVNSETKIPLSRNYKVQFISKIEK